MSNVREIKINTLSSGVKIPVIAQQVVFWSITLGALLVSERLFGGHWVTDVIALMFSFFWLLAMGNRLTGSTVFLTKPEIKAWVDAGMPDDVKAWKASQ